jgi:hypothetical protein
MVLHGILDQALQQYCIRGFATAQDLAKLSEADSSYQRNWIRKQGDLMAKFMSGDRSFFPEVIMSFTLPLDLQVADRTDELGRYLPPTPFPGTRVSTEDGALKFQVKRANMPERTVPTGRPSTYLQTVSIDIDEDKLAGRKPFFRIDGNHRLTAGSEGEAGQVQIPFCLVLFNATTPGTKTLERQFFNDINSKSQPLTLEERLRVIVDPESGIPDTDLQDPDKFGLPYLFTRHTFQMMGEKDSAAAKREFQTLYPLLFVTEDGQTYRRTLCYRVYELLLDLAESDNILNNEGITERFVDYQRFGDSLKKVEVLFGARRPLRETQATGLLIASVYFAFRGNEGRLHRFLEWAVRNHIDEQTEVNATDIVQIFESLEHGRNRTVFVSMPYGGDCELHYEAIAEVVKEMNEARGYREKYDLRPLRIDQVVKGETHKISDSIIQEMSESGLLIADLTFSNPNVYHEIGYIMGMAQHTKGASPSLLLLCNERLTPLSTVGFNIRGYHIIAFKDTRELKPKLRKQLEACYQEGNTPRIEEVAPEENSVSPGSHIKD